jgi:hypothetical protein
MARNDLQPYPVAVTLAVTEEDIRFGLAQDSYSCALAHAIYRTFPSAMRVRVTKKTIGWSDEDNGVRYIYPTPPLADERVIRPNDTGGEVKPTRIRLTGGQFREVQHKNKRETREQMRKMKHDDPDAYERIARHRTYKRPVGDTGPRGSSRVYDRYVPTPGDL